MTFRLTFCSWEIEKRVGMKETADLQAIFQKFFPRRIKKIEVPKDLSLKEREKEAFLYLAKGEELLYKNHLTGLPFFEAATELMPIHPGIWLRQGKAVFSYGVNKAHEKALLLASKCFKIASSQDPLSFESRLFWGKALFQLGEISQEHHYFLEAKTKFQEALELCEGKPAGALAQNYWDLGLIWTHLAHYSGEAVDLRMAIDSFRSSLNYQKQPRAQFWNDFGNAHFQMALLINDNRIYSEAIQLFQKSIQLDPAFNQGWISLASTYTQLYINTAEERYFNEANDCFAKALELKSQDEDLLLRWAQLLGESGKLNHDSKKLKGAIEKCAKAYTFAENVEKVVAQWVESLSLLGSYTNNLDDIVQAEEKILQATEEYPQDPDLWYAYGICLSSYAAYYDDPNYYDLAVEKLQLGLSLDRSNAELWHATGQCYSQIGQMVQDPEALRRSWKFFQKAIDLKPCCPTLTFDYAISLLKLSELTGDFSVLETALHHFETLLQNQKDALLNHPEWLFFYACGLDLLADHMEEDKHYLRAIEVFSHVLLLEPDYPHIHFKIGMSYCHLGELTSVEECFHRALNYFRIAANNDEENEYVWLEWGIALINLAHITYDSALQNQYYQEAEQKINRAGQLGNQNAYYHLACLYSLNNRLAEAMNLIEKAAKLDVLPSMEELLHDDWLESLRKTESFAHFLAMLESRQKAVDDEII
jgi:tetratricopeptide (TPR) repeat protein